MYHSGIFHYDEVFVRESWIIIFTLVRVFYLKLVYGSDARFCLPHASGIVLFRVIVVYCSENPSLHLNDLMKAIRVSYISNALF